jgi:hypothetical protein
MSQVSMTRVVVSEIVERARYNAAFDPETVTLLANAFENAWHRIRASGDRFARPAYAGGTREVIAKYIIDMAGRGERDLIKLSDGAVEFLAANYNAEPVRRQCNGSEVSIA